MTTPEGIKYTVVSHGALPSVSLTFCVVGPSPTVRKWYANVTTINWANRKG